VADIASTDVVYSITSKQRKEESGNKVTSQTITFGNGTLTYPAGGIPLDKNKMGCPNTVVTVNLSSPASSNGFIYKYDLVNNKIRIFQGDNTNVAAAPLIELVASTATPAAATIALDAIGW
jgi:hypothetical protein